MRLALSAFVLAASVALGATDARACSCIDVPPAAALAEHDVVFEGRVTALAHEGGFLVASLDVVQHWKGMETEHTTVRTAEASPMCGVAFEVGTSWLVYADREGDTLTTGICSRTRRIEDAADDLEVLAAGVVPIEIGPGDAVEDDTIDEPPARGGCGSCSAGGGAAPSAFWIVGVLALVWRRRATCP